MNRIDETMDACESVKKLNLKKGTQAYPTPESKLPHSKLEKLGFEYVENLNVYQAGSSDNCYYGEVVEIKIFDDLSASIFMTDIHSKWSRDISRKAITALSSQNLSW